MLLPGLAVAALLQAGQAPAADTTGHTLLITPERPVITAGDTLRLRATLRDAQGREVPNATIRFFGAGGRFEGEVSEDGLVRSGSTGTLTLTVAALVPGQGPVTRQVPVAMVAGPAARVAITPRVGKLVVGQTLRLTGTAYSAADDRRADRMTWRSSAPAVARVDANGIVTAVGAGRATISAGAGSASAALPIEVVATSVADLTMTPSTVNARTGDVVRFAVTAKDGAGRTIAGLTPTFTFSPGNGVLEQDGTFVGYEPGSYLVTATLGTRTVSAPVTLERRNVRRAAEVVGRLPRTRFTTEEVWLHPNGRNAYLGSGSGGDVLYVLDISDPAAPTVTDSLVVDTRRVNDAMTTPDGKFLVFTREGASSRRNGIVIASLEDPAHPKVISEFTEGVTAGVHSAFVYNQPDHGTHVYLTNDGTGAFHVIDINDPYNPKQVAEWRTDRPDAGRTLHDVDVQDGLAYLSYWNDGLVILDVGNGKKGGSPSNPQLVSQFKYDLNDLYSQVEAAGGPGFIRGTHTAWRHKDYVFIADEVFPASGVKGAKDASAGRAYGRLQVVDISDTENPRSVAWYEPEYGGVHNIWVAGDTLYMGAYNAGFRTFDISGELRGDLRAQEREMVHLNTADMTGRVQNTAMTWGVVVRDGLAYVNDMNNGLWIVRMLPSQRPQQVVP